MNDQDKQFEATPPHDEDAERAYLGSLIICDEPSARTRLRKMLWREAFFAIDHQALFTLVAGMIDQDRETDVVTVHSELKQRGMLDEVGGSPGLARILNSVPTWKNGEHYGEKIIAHATRRQGIAAGMRLARRLQQPIGDETIESVLSDAADDVWRVSRQRPKTAIFTMDEILNAWEENKRNRRAAALETGVETLDEFRGLFSFGKYTIVAARPSMGKSTMIRWLLEQWAKAGTPVGLVAVEEDRQKIAGNYVASNSGLENDYVAYQEFGERDWQEYANARESLHGIPWCGCDDAFTLSQVAAAAEYMILQKGCRVVAVDHLHLIKPDRRSDNEQREIKDISARMKELAKTHGVVLIAAAQLSRPSEKVRVPPPPTLTDLRQSGSIEEHADAVVMLHREDYYRKGEVPTYECELHVNKNRNGKQGICKLKAVLKHQRFEYLNPDCFAGSPAPVMQLPYRDTLEDI